MTPERLDELERFALEKLRACVTEHVAKFVADLAKAGHDEDEIRAICARQQPEMQAWVAEKIKEIRPWITSAAYGIDVHDLA